MKIPARPINEDARLASLDKLHILDTQNEERYERIVRLAGIVFDASVSSFALVDRDRVWFKASVGFVDQGSERARDFAFAAHALLSEEPLIVPDTLEDPRFHTNTSVTGPMKIRSYIGQAIKAPDGHNIGVLNIASRAPITALTSQHYDALRLCRAMLEEELERSPAFDVGPQQPESHQEQTLTPIWRGLMLTGNDAKILLDQNMRLLDYNGTATEYFLLDQDHIGDNFLAVENLLSYPGLQQDIGEVITHGVALERRIKCIRGRYLICQITPYRQPKESRFGVIIGLQDMSIVRRHRLLAAVISKLPGNIALIDRSGNIIFTNAAWDSFARRNGAPMSMGVAEGVNYLEVCDNAELDEAKLIGDAIRDVISGQRGRFSHMYTCTTSEGDLTFHMSVNATHALDGAAVICHLDVTDWTDQGHSRRSDLTLTRHE